MLLLVPLCAIVGDQIGYWIGRKAGQALYRREDSLSFRKRHLDRAHQFYEKYGGKTVILARFVPIVRTFCPPVAGAAMMPYGRYFAYDVAGGLLWVGSMILGGYFLGSMIPNISENIHYVIAGRHSSFAAASHHQRAARQIFRIAEEPLPFAQPAPSERD